mmetsp:Transcript_14/g.13  ORF Transcript_14/g.13 Transcript_14/m.13 type:complete len:364 (-) Transcript_14:88-1179(-)
MLFMTESIQMETSSSMSDGMKRFMTGQALFVTDFTATDVPGEVTLGPAFPSKILRLNLQEYGDELICQKGAYIASNHSINIDLAFAKNFSAGFFGGEGFVLQKLTGSGDVLLQACGTLVRKDLEEGETLRVSSGTLVAFTNTVDYDVQMMPGFKNVMFGGEGLFVTTLKGPGVVWLQSMPPDRMISEIARKVPSGGIGLGIPIGVGGGVGGGENTIEGEDSNGIDGVTASETDIDQQEISTDVTDGENINSDSPEALFGDAAPKVPMAGASTSQEDDFLNVSEPDNGNDDSTMGFSEETKFSTDEWKEDFDDLQDDNTSFSTYDENSESGGKSFDTEGFDSDGDTETSSNLLSTIWKFFSDDD